MSFKIYPYRQGSRSARALADALGGRVLRLEGSHYRERQQDTIINWGSASDACPYPRILNPVAAVRTAGNKLLTFERLRANSVSIPEFWTRREDIPDEAFPIVCRTILNGHSGHGIVIADDRASLVNAPLYVRYVKKLDEYRIHVGRRGVDHFIISVQRKAKRNGAENVNTRVRNLENGYVFVRGGVNPPASVIEQAELALTALNLDFGAVDVIYNQRRETAYVLEINTAPGLEGQTVTDYTEFFRAA